MDPIVGNEKQEEIITKVGTLANTLFPEIGLYPFKGLFRVSIGAALEKTDYRELKELWAENSETRAEFFGHVIEESRTMLEHQGLSPEQVETLARQLRIFYSTSMTTERDKK